MIDSLPDALFMIGVLLALLVIYRIDQSDDNAYQFVENLMTNGKPDVYKLVYFTAAMMMIWVLFKLANDGSLTEFYVTAFVGGVLLGALGNSGMQTAERLFGNRVQWTEEQRKDFKVNGSLPHKTDGANSSSASAASGKQGASS